MLDVLRQRDFRLLALGQAVSLIGDGIYLVSIAWLVFDISNSPGALAIIGFAWTLPQVGGVLVAGVLSDHFERRRLLVLADLGRCAAIGTIATLAFAGVAELWSLATLVFIYGIGEALFHPAVTGIIPDLVPRAQLVSANAFRELMEPLGTRFVGPALGGGLIALVGVATALALDAATFAISAVFVARMRRDLPTARSVLSMRRDLGEGLRYVRARAWLWGSLVGGTLFMFLTFGPFQVILPYIIRNDLGGSAATFSAVLAAGGLGSICAALTLSRRGLPQHPVTLMWIGWALSIALLVGFAIADSAWQMYLVAFASALLGTGGIVIWNTLVTMHVPSEMLGRVSSFDWFASLGLMPLSYAVTGPVVAVLGPQTALATAGLLGSATVLFLLVPGIRDPERNEGFGGRTLPASSP